MRQSPLAETCTLTLLRQIIIVFLALTLAVFLSFLDQTIVSTGKFSSPPLCDRTNSAAALISISASFNAGRSSSWVASAYLLTSTAFQPVWGRLSDVYVAPPRSLDVLLIASVNAGSVAKSRCSLASSYLPSEVLPALSHSP